jgi:hypothetical protein
MDRTQNGEKIVNNFAKNKDAVLTAPYDQLKAKRQTGRDTH